MTKETIKNAVLGALWNFEKSGYTAEELAEHVAWLLNADESPPVATTYTKDYVPAPFGTEGSPLELVTLKRDEAEIAAIPEALLREMLEELRPILDSENVK